VAVGATRATRGAPRSPLFVGMESSPYANGASGVKLDESRECESGTGTGQYHETGHAGVPHRPKIPRATAYPSRRGLLFLSVRYTGRASFLRLRRALALLGVVRVRGTKAIPARGIVAVTYQLKGT
jgi:hypothetical protein